MNMTPHEMRSRSKGLSYEGSGAPLSVRAPEVSMNRHADWQPHAVNREVHASHASKISLPHHAVT